ncbi:serine hydrolase-like protein 2 isoform X2 [Sceloporus undulatus]|uniref:serine hydrolase-like protein 2 isoform X2 n=1 Tax=Sceloporus undulatus TaxID=8520 RepID=UPI001C4D2F55|nr:serine hydrolase-like protein 2 isoform X2 [Sceloporus undulatus]
MAGLVSELKFLVPWGHIAAKAWGSPQGRPVLCLHGWLDNANTFSKLIPLLPKDCYYMALDFAGHGLSSHRPAGCPYYLIDHVSDVRRVAASLKWNRFSLMGHSMGGTVAGMFACIFPELVDKLILVESCGFYPSPQGYHKGPETLRKQKASSRSITRDDISNLEEWEKILYGHRIVIDNLLNVDGKQHQALRVRSSEKALQRLLEANNDLTEESGKILLERGATKVPGGLVYNRDIRLLSHTSHPTHIEYQVNYVKKIQADVLMIIAQDGIFTKQSPEHLSEYSVIIQEAFRASRKEHFQYAEVSGNHFVHLNEPEVVAGIVSTFLNNNQNLKAKL